MNVGRLKVMKEKMTFEVGTKSGKRDGRMKDVEKSIQKI